MFRLRQLQKELTLQKRLFGLCLRQPEDPACLNKWRAQQALVEQAQQRLSEAQATYLAAVFKAHAGLRVPAVQAAQLKRLCRLSMRGFPVTMIPGRDAGRRRVSRRAGNSRTRSIRDRSHR